MKDIEFVLPPFTVTHVVQTLSQVHGWGIEQLHVPDTWKITKGKNIRCLVLDTGFSDHVDLEGGIDKDASRDFVNEGLDDLNGHSTHCLGIIGARDNSAGMVGVAPECTLITGKILNKQGTGGLNPIVKALQWARHLKPDVVSMSVGAPIYNRYIHTEIQRLYQMNIPVICAAGNNPKAPVSFPAAFPETIAVTAYDKNGKPAFFNSIGEQVDFSAPGVDIYSTYLRQSYAELSGTSMSTPFMAGLVCLLLSKHRIQEEETGKNDCITVDQIKEHLIKYADDKGIVGKDHNWGYGVVNPREMFLHAKMFREAGGVFWN